MGPAAPTHLFIKDVPHQDHFLSLSPEDLLSACLANEALNEALF
jgi:hypothetical protein